MGPSGHPDPEISEEGRGGGGGIAGLQKNFLGPFGPQVWSKNKGGGAPGPLP